MKAARIAVAIAATLLVGCADDETTSTDGGAAGMGGAGASGGAGGSGGAADGGGGSGGIGGSSALCGDGVLDPNEACDDGNATAGDGCDADCAIESGYTCPTPNAPCTLLDGNCAAPFPIVLTDVAGALRGGYDGDTTGADDDVAAASCDGQTIGTGGDAIHVFSLPDTLDVTVRSTFASGDGHIRVLTAPCDATQRAGGEPGFGDGCANGEAAAETEEITLLSMPPGDYYVVVDSQAGDEGAYALDVVAVTSTCENGTLEGVEECDDDNGINGDGCSQCVIDPHYTCSFTPSQCTNTCQDGVVDTAVLEQCDDGNATDGDRCSASCMLEHTVVEIEPNDSAVDAQPIADGDILLGSLQPFGDIDIYELVLTTDSFVLLETYETIDADPVNGSGGLGLLGDLPDCPAAGETDMYLFDDTSNVYDTGAALFADDLDGAGFCAFIGPNADATLLTAGTYYVRINDHAGGTMDHYVLDVTVRQPLGPGEMCSPQNDLCDPTQFLFCDGTTSLCTNNCGNGLVDAGEECDDGDADDNDRCNTSCILNADVVDNGNNDTFATGQPLASGEVARGSLDDSVDLFDVYTFTVATPSWVIMELYTTVDGDTGNYTGNGLDPELDCYDNLDLWLYDGTGDPSNTNTAWQFAFSDGDGNCDFFGPPSDGEWAYLPAGDYQVVVRESGIPNPVMLYALELQIVPALTTGDACNASFDLCHPFQNIDCDGTSTCFPRQTDRTSHQIFSNDFDLQNTTLTMRPTGGTYDVVATAALGYPDTPGTGSPTSNPPLFATDTVAVTTSFDFFGTTYTTVHVNSDGNITFDGGVPFAQQFTHFDVRRVSWFFDFLDPGAGGTVTLDRFVDRLTVTFHQVPRLSSVNVVEAQTQLFDDGTVTITHLNTTAGSAWVGISAGDALNTWPDEVDFSAHTLRAAASGDLIINEFLADPTGVDSNCDSTVDAAQDELVELVNVAGVPIDLNGVTLSDATQIRFTFGPLTLGAGRAVVVYGGGASQCANVNGVVAAGLDLDDTGDTITLSTGDSVTYGATTSGISRTRDPDVFGVFKDHDIAVGATANLSPGMRVIDWPF